MAVGEESVQTAVGAGQAEEVPFYVVPAASWATEEVACNDQNQFIRECEERHRGGLYTRIFSRFGAKKRAEAHSGDCCRLIMNRRIYGSSCGDHGVWKSDRVLKKEESNRGNRADIYRAKAPRDK